MGRITLREIIPIWINFFFLFAGFAVVVPYLQLFFAAQGFEPSQIGLLLGTFEVAGILGPLVIGHLADRRGSFRSVIVACVVASLAAFNLLNQFSLFAFVLPLAFLSGFAYKSIIPLADAQASSLMVSPELDYGRARVLGSIGFIVSSAFFQFTGLLSGAAGQETPQAAPIITAITVLLLLYLAVAFLMPARPPAAEHVAAARPRESRSSEAPGGFDRAFWLFIGIVFLARIGISSYYSFFSLYLEAEVGSGLVSGMWAIGATAEIPIILFSGRLIRRFGIMPLLVAGFGSVVVRLVIYALFPYAPVIAVTQLLHAFTFGLLHSVSIAYINRRIPVQRRGLGMAVYSSVALGLSVFVGSSLGGFVVEAFGFDRLFLGYAAIPAAAIVILLFQSHRLGLTPAADG